VQPDNYEQRAWHDIATWERRGPSLATKLGRLAAAPAEIATNLLVPRRIQDLIGESLGSMLTTANEAVHKTVRPERLMQRLAERGHQLESHMQLRQHHLPLSDDIGIHESRRHITVTTISGAATGLGGIMLLAADVPALFAVNLRMVQSIALGYGYDLADPAERHYALHLFRIAAGDPRTRIGLSQELAVVRGALTRSALDEIATASAIATGMQTLRRMAAKVGIEIAERKLLAMVPIIGAGIGAGFNYLFTNEVAAAARMGYRKRWLMEKYPEYYRATPTHGSGTSDDPLEGTIVG